MTRRISAMIGIVVILALVAGLIWAVYVHHTRAGRDVEETSVVELFHKTIDRDCQSVV